MPLDLEIGMPERRGLRERQGRRHASTTSKVALRIREARRSAAVSLVETFAERVARLLLDEFGAPG